MALNASTGNTLSSRAQIETAVELSLQKPATAGTAAVNPNAVVVCLGCAKKLAFSISTLTLATFIGSRNWDAEHVFGVAGSVFYGDEAPHVRPERVSHTIGAGREAVVVAEEDRLPAGRAGEPARMVRVGKTRIHALQTETARAPSEPREGYPVLRVGRVIAAIKERDIHRAVGGKRGPGIE